MWKKRKINLFIIILCFFYTISVHSQAPFSHGINLTGWFQVNNPGQIQFTRYTKQDIINIKTLGCDVIRLPVNMNSMTLGSPSYTLDPLYLSLMDSIVTWCEQLNIYLMIDNHSFDPDVNTSPSIEDILIKVWSQMALHYKDRSDYILYEILNEPHGISTAVWGVIQNKVIKAIRDNDTRHTIVVGGAGYNSCSELSNLPVYTDLNLLYTFHFYDPFMFTHQGASWVTPSMEPLAGVPFPYNASEMPACPESLTGTWIESSLNNYPFEGIVSHIELLIDEAINFRNNRNVNIFCGEFGVYIPNSNTDDRSFWYKIVRQYLEENDIPWTIWDYKGSFGLFNEGSNELFEHDLNISLLESLDFIIPDQTPYYSQPDSVGFNIYTDFTGQHINDLSYSSGLINFYSTDMPNNNQYSLSWKNFSQYNTLGFDFSPDKDLSKLLSEGYSIDFMVRGSDPGIKFDIRFMDSKTDISGDHPWRTSSTIDENNIIWDRKWHHVHILLSDFNESGSWDNNTWYNPEGKFDWTKVNKFEISTEYPVTPGKQIWFDNIHITNLDTAIVRETGVLGIEKLYGQPDLQPKASPNPMKDYVIISYILPVEQKVNVSIYSLSGNNVRTLVDETQNPGYHSLYWDGCNNNGNNAHPGIYLYRLSSQQYFVSGKIIKY